MCISSVALTHMCDKESKEHWRNEEIVVLKRKEKTYGGYQEEETETLVVTHRETWRTFEVGS